MRCDKSLLRAAISIRAHLAKRRDEQQAVRLPCELWKRLEQLARQINRAKQRGFALAANRLLLDLACQAECLQTYLRALASDWQSQARPPHLASESETYRDLAALRDQFENVACDLERRTLSVRTQPIELEDVHLGPFDIVLEWDSFGSTPSYRVVALEPNPAADNPNVTHPHVKGERLCEGEGHAAIRAALEQGRLEDFFVLVGQVLDTYSVGNGYVELDQWGGGRCVDCDCFVAEEEEYRCGACETTLCAECEGICTGCEGGFCSRCMASCSCCDAACCNGCSEACAVCHKEVCPACREDRVCIDCRNQQETEDEPDARDGDES